MCCGAGDSKVHAVGNNSFVRWNGWTLPLNPLQVMSWIVQVYIGFIFFGVVALAVEARLWPAVYICVGIFYVLHIICYLWATSINPADAKSSERILNKDRPLPTFNRSLHRHVIEDDYCHICEVLVGNLSKHCSVCNKCVAVFDHHCKWLNNCIGEKNYQIFLAMLLSAILGCVGMLVASLFVLVNFVQDFKPSNQYVWWSTTSSSQLAFEVLIGVEVLFLVIALVLLMQLFTFHISLIYKGITTYEYVKRDMNRKKAKERQQQQEHSNQVESDSGAGCNNVTDVVEPSGRDVNPIDEQFVHSQKEIDSLPKHPLMKTLGSGYSNGVFSPLENPSWDILSMNANSNNILSCGNLSYDDDSGHSSTSAPKPSARVSFNSKESSSMDRSHVLPNVVPDTDVQIHTLSVDLLPPKHGKKRKKKASNSLPLQDTSSRPLPKPLFTVMECPPSSSLRNTQLPPIRDTVDWMSSSEDLTKGAMKSKKLPALSTSSSITSVSKSMVSEV